MWDVPLLVHRCPVTGLSRKLGQGPEGGKLGHLLYRASYASQAANWLLQKSHWVNEITPEVEQPKVEDEIPY